MPTLKRKSRFPRAASELAGPFYANDAFKGMALGIDYKILESEHYFTEKAFARLEANQGERSGETGGASDPDDKAPLVSRVGNFNEEAHVGTSPIPPGGVEVYASPALSLSRYGTPPSCGDERERRLIVSKFFPNPGIVIAKDAQDTEYHVWVGLSSNFVVGMPLNAVPHPTETAWWKAVPPLPETKGHW